MAIYEEEDFNKISDKDNMSIEEKVFRLKKLRAQERKRADLAWLKEAYESELGGEG